jgi:GTPase
MSRPQIIAANKMDMPDAEENLKQFKEKIGFDIPVYPISALTKDGLRDLLFAVADLLETIPKITEEIEETDETVVYRYQKEDKGFEINRDDDGAFVLSGPKIEKLFKMTDFNRDEAVRRFARQMRSMGVDEELRKRGAEDGDTIRILQFEFEFVD